VTAINAVHPAFAIQLGDLVDAGKYSLSLYSSAVFPLTVTYQYDDPCLPYTSTPLTVTQAVKDKILELQPGLPPGVHIVPAYDRTRLIHGAIHTLTEVMWHEMLIASVAIRRP
jgi:hypothetical protein